MMSSGLIEEAESYFEIDVEENPFVFPAWQSLAYARALRGDVKGTLQAAEYANALSPDDVAGHISILWGLPHENLEQAKELLMSFTTLADNTGASGAIFRRDVLANEIAMVEKDSSKAQGIAERYENINPLWAGIIYLRLGDERAEKQFDLAASPPYFDRRFMFAFMGFIPSEHRELPTVRRALDKMGFTHKWRLELCRRASTMPPHTGIGCDPSKYELQ